MSFEADEVIHPMVKCIKIREKGTEERFGRKLIKSDTPKMRFVMIALNLSSMLCPILQIASTNWMGKSLKPSCLARHPTFSSFVSVNGLNW